MSEFRNNAASSTSKSRASGFKSPSAHDTLDSKSYRKKYQKKAQELQQQKQRTLHLSQLLEQMARKLQKQQRQLAKKQQIEDVLLQQISQLKAELDDSRIIKATSKENSLQEKRSKGSKGNKQSFQCSNNISNISSEFSPSIRMQSKVNGYNFTLSDVNNNSNHNSSQNNNEANNNNTYQSDYSQASKQCSSSSIRSVEGQSISDEKANQRKVGGYFASIFSK